MHLILTNEPKFKRRNYGSSTFTDVSLPSGVTQVSPAVRPCFALYKRRTYIVGQFSSNLVWTEFSDLWASGIASTSTAPTATVGSGTGITAAGVRYRYTMKEMDGSTTVAESSLSNASVALSVTNKSIDVSGLPTTHANARVTHKGLYRSDNGGSYRLVANIALGTSTYSDTTATLSLGAIAPNANHGVPPYCKFVEVYHDRLWYAGDPSYKDRVWYSELGEGEAVGSLSYIATRDGEEVTGIKRCGDELVVFTPQSAYSIKGFTEADFTMKKLSPSVGCISHHSIVNIDETLFFASESGVYTYNGAFKFQMEDLRDYWRDAYSAAVTTYQDCIAIDDRYHRGYKLLIPASNAFYYFGHYDPVFRGEQPYWVFDSRTRQDKTLGILTPSSGSHRYDQFVGSCDGYVRQDNVEAENDDDSDSAAKAMIIQTGAMLMGDPGGGIEEGKSFPELWTYVESESTAWRLQALGGDEDVVNHITADNSSHWWKDDRDATALTSGGFIYTAASVHHHFPERVAGRALCLKITATSPVGFKYRGFGGVYGPGPAQRPPKSTS